MNKISIKCNLTESFAYDHCMMCYFIAINEIEQKVEPPLKFDLILVPDTYLNIN